MSAQEQTSILSVLKEKKDSLESTFFHTWGSEQVAQWLTLYDYKYLVPYFKEITGKMLYSWFDGEKFNEEKFKSFIPDHIETSTIFTLLETLDYYRQPCVKMEIGGDTILLRNGELSFNGKLISNISNSHKKPIRVGNANIFTGAYITEPVTFNL